MRFLWCVFVLVPATCGAWWQEVPDEKNPETTYQSLLLQQVDDPHNPTVSYNLGIAAASQGKYAVADSHFELATELFDQADSQRLPAYFSWADSAAHQLVQILKAHQNITGKNLDDALAHAQHARERYANVLVIDGSDQEAHKRKKIIEQLEQMLKQKKQQDEQQQKQEQDKEQQKNGGDKDAEQNKDSSQNQSKQDGSDQQQSGNQSENNAGHKDTPREGSKQEQGTQNKSNGQQQQESGAQDGAQEGASDAQTNEERGADKQEESGGSDAQDERSTEKQESGDGQDQSAEHEQGQSAVSGSVQRSSEQIAEDMAHRRAVVLLDKLEKKEADLQKRLLREKSQSQSTGYARYNQW